MLLTKYKLQSFVKEFEKPLREPLGKEMTDKQIFAELKQELVTHLKTIDESLDLKVFEDLNIYLEGVSLCFSYKETTGQPMVIRLVRRVNDLTPKLVKDYIFKFIKEELGGDDFPYVTFPRSFNYQHLAIYWPQNKIIAISNHMYQQLEQKEVESILRHEAIHHFLNTKGEPASDVDDEFIELLLKHKGYLSQEVSAQAALVKFIREKERKEKLAKQKEARLAKKREESKEK